MSLAVGVIPFSLEGNNDKHKPLGMKRSPTNEENQNHGHCKREDESLAIHLTDFNLEW